MVRLFVSSAFIILLLAGCAGEKQLEVTLTDKVRDLTNTAAFARSPQGTARMGSSYDQTGGNADWATWRETGPDGLVDVVNLQGPGCVERIWMTSVRGDEWLFFFDGEEEPRLRLTRKELFGGKFPFVPPLCDSLSGGFYCYMPLPFAESLRIAVRMPEIQPQWRQYYHVNYEVFPEGAKVESFPRRISAEQEDAMRDVIGVWSNAAGRLRSRIARCEVEHTGVLEPGSAATVFQREGGGCIETLSLRMETKDGTTALEKVQPLRDVQLRIYWDGLDKPSVAVPVGDFFCNPYFRRAFAALPMGNVDDTFVCAFPMPFAESAKVELVNTGRLPVEIQCGVDLTDRSPEDKLYFHSKWGAMQRGGVPFEMLAAAGKGHYAGCYLNVIGTDGSWHILEGDEVIRVDDGDRPMLHGTGLEDYFNGGWYYFGIFDRPLHGLVEKAPIRTGQYRFHLNDRVPFEKNISVTFEFGDANRSRGYMSGVAYWYQTEPSPAGSVISPGRLKPPADPLRKAAIMAHLFEFERIGHFDEARQRCLQYAERFEPSPAAEVIKLRAAAYAELIDGIDATAPVYERIIKKSPESPAASQAEKLLWFHEDQENALLGVHANAAYKVYVDGKLVGEGGHPVALQVYQLKLEPGNHVVTAEVTPQRNDAWFSAYLRTHGANIVTDRTWQYVKEKPENWPETGALEGLAWTNSGLASARAILPKMNYWQFAPNAFVNMQSGKQLLRPWKGWDRNPGQSTAYLKKEFTIAGANEDNRR